VVLVLLWWVDIAIEAKTSPWRIKIMLHPGSVRPHVKKGNSQAHEGVAPLDPITHRNTGYQPLPRPLGLAPYHYALTDHFQTVAKHIKDAGKMVFDVLGDSGGVQDAEFQSSVANEMVKALAKAHTTIITPNSTKPMSSTPRPYSLSPAIMMERLTIQKYKRRWMAGWPTSCSLSPTWTQFQKTRPVWD
jgi:hypothetical protein